MSGKAWRRCDLPPRLLPNALPPSPASSKEGPLRVGQGQRREKEREGVLTGKKEKRQEGEKTWEEECEKRAKGRKEERRGQTDMKAEG